MRDLYSRVLGLMATDEDEERGIVFLSSHPRGGAPRVRPAAGPHRRSRCQAHPPGVVARGLPGVGHRLPPPVSRVGHRGPAGGHARQRDRELLLRPQR
ncbi:hypothetical protein [Streptomyces adelaidensis]|uniref:hypothetical protein n=1 Tax=Streptomyces adelaidensis TaxID=2796465 RepID=UPI0035575A35